MDATATRLLALRSRVLRARAQARLLQADFPGFREDLEEIERLLVTAWRAVSDLIEPLIPSGANDTDEDIAAEQQRLAAEVKRMERAGAMKGIEP